MDDYKAIEIETAKKYGATAKGTRKSIGDFLLDYSPNIISAKRLIKWLQQEGNHLYFIFVNYKKTDQSIEVIDDSGLVPVEHLNWHCLTIEAQGWGVIQMVGDLETDEAQDKKGFFRGMRQAYEKYIDKETQKMAKIREMIKDF